MAKGIHQILGALGEARQLLQQRGDGMGARLRALTSGAA